MKFSPVHYAAAMAAGVSHMEMVRNMDERARQLGRFFESAITAPGKPWTIEEIVGEAQDLRDYREAFLSFALDRNRSPLNTKRPNHPGLPLDESGNPIVAPPDMVAMWQRRAVV